MSRNKKPVLNEKHLKALALIEAGTMSLKDMAAQVGWSADYLYDLYEGDTAKAGEVASFFKAEVKAIHKKRDSKIKELLKSNTEAAHALISKQLKYLNDQAKLSLDERKLIATYMNAIAKATPNVQIDNLSYSWTKGYTAEQMVYEFKRLQTLAGGSSNRGAVPEAGEGRSGVLPQPTGPGGEISRSKEIARLRASTEA